MQSFVTQQVEPHQKLFDEMLNRFSLSAKALAEAADVSEVMISRFRRGKVDLGAAKLMALLTKVPQEAREWYLSELLGVKLNTTLRALILSADPADIEEILRLLADRWAITQKGESADRSAVTLAS